MDPSLILVACTQGMVLGIVGFDFYHRLRDKRDREAMRDELKTAQEGLATLHNKNVQVMQSLQDKVGAHDAALKMAKVR